MDLFVRGSAPLDRDVLNRWVGPSQVELLVAGSIGYTVQVFAKLDWHVDVCSTVGSDAFGATIRRDLEAAGIDCRFMEQADGLTAIGIYMMLFGGHKRPLTVRFPDFEPWPDPPPALEDHGADDAPPLSLLHSGGLLHFPDMWHRGQADLFARMRRAGVMTSIDPQFPLTDTPAPWLPLIADVLSEADVLLCDEHEGTMLFQRDRVEDIVKHGLACGPRVVAVKRGAGGAVVGDRNGLVSQPAARVDQAAVREAVGAGDAFDAGFLDRLSDGADLREAARFATACAAVTLNGRGGAEAIVGRASVEAALELVPESVVTPWH
jgi:sugar/nucleoside kinase (ribokinase family)